MLVQHGAILSICSKYSESMKGLLLSIARSPTLITHHDLNLTCEFLRYVRNLDLELLQYCTIFPPSTELFNVTQIQ